ncbi:MAG: hypothetical protein BAJALOKI3v1_520009 [Promethearchaeota archaeon]|nr:MAG: hypothetical protein BAJALOKI3v1_520009 [Candidatus Lokiarchaeota archaeon]
MVESYKTKEKLKKKYQLKKPKFDSDFDHVEIVYKSRSPWAADNYEEFISINNQIKALAEKNIEESGRTMRKVFNRILEAANERGEFAELALVYNLGLELFVSGVTNKDNNEAISGIKLMKEALELCGKLPTCSKYAKKINKYISSAESEIDKI